MEAHYVMLTLFIASAFYTDVKESRIPNHLNVCGVVIGAVYHGSVNGWSGLTFAIFGLCTGLLTVTLLYLFGALGAGDVKLFAAIGSLCGTPFVLHSLMYSIVYGALIGIGILMFRRSLGKRIIFMTRQLCSFLLLRNFVYIQEIGNSDNVRFPFMYAVLPGVATAYIYII